MSDIVTKKPGRPPGSGYRQEMYDKFVKPNSERMIKMGIALAMGGEPTILKFWLERMVPKNPMPVGMDLGGTAREQFQKILGYTSAGDISFDDALKAASIIKESQLIDKVEFLTAKLEKLEQWMSERATNITQPVLEHKPDE